MAERRPRVHKVALYGPAIGGFARVEEGATFGAVLGVNLFNPDGTLVTASQFRGTQTIVQQTTSSGGGGGGAAVWGGITGSLASQADLVAALGAKEGTIAAGTTAQYWRGDKSWQTLDKAAVGLSNVDNTSDAAKPVSTAQATALGLKLNASAVSAFGLTLVDDVDAPAARSTLGLGTLATQSGTFSGTHSGTSSGTNTGDQTLAGLGGQPLDATLTALAAANWAANAIPIGTGADALSQVAFGANTFPARASTGSLVAKVITDLALNLLDDATQGDMRTTLGLGSMATQAAASYAALASSPTFTGNVIAPAFVGSGSSAEVANNGAAGFVVLKPNGIGSAVGQAVLDSTGTLALAKALTMTDGFISTNPSSSYFNAASLTNTGGVQFMFNANGNSEGNIRTVTNHPLTFSTNNTQRGGFAAAGQFNLVPMAAPGSPSNGDIWYDSALGKFRKREGGVTSDIGALSGSGAFATLSVDGTSTFGATSGSPLVLAHVGGVGVDHEYTLGAAADNVRWKYLGTTLLQINSAGLAVPTAAAGDNSTKPASTAYHRANSGFSTYRTLLDSTGSHIAARVAGTYFIPQGQPLGITGTGTLYSPNIIYLDPADYPTVDGLPTKLRIRCVVAVNDVAPTGTFTIGLHPVTRPNPSGGAGLNIYTIGAAVAGSTVALATPAADSLNNVVGADFTIPAAGFYCIGVVTTATVAASSHMHFSATLQLRQA